MAVWPYTHWNLTITMENAGLHPTLNATTENPDLILKGPELHNDDCVAYPEYTRDAQDDTMNTDVENKPMMRDPLVLVITCWTSQTLPSQEEESLKQTRRLS